MANRLQQPQPGNIFAGPPPPMMNGMPPMEDDIIGAIKIKDGLFIGDEFAAQVRKIHILGIKIVGFGICSRKQSHPCSQLRW
jgi:hypothetical protein